MSERSVVVFKDLFEGDEALDSDLAAKVRELRKQLRVCRRELEEAKAANERLQALLGHCCLDGWHPQEVVERQYGWVHAWMFPLYSYLNENLGAVLTPETRNRAIDICRAIIAQLVVEGKYGVKLPFDPREVDIAAFVQKQRRTLEKRYEPCVICGEDRITHECHIIPRSEGGPLHRDNMVILCPLHHHLFDQHRLLPDEWKKLIRIIEREKMDAAVVYAREVRLPQLRQFWVERGVRVSDGVSTK